MTRGVLTQMDDTNNNGKKRKKKSEQRFAMHKISNATAFFSAGEGQTGSLIVSTNMPLVHVYTFLITAHLYVDKRGTGGLNKWASLNKLPCIIAHACVPVIPYRYGARLAVMRYECASEKLNPLQTC